ncbi:MAG TPA: glycerophosphodiester phosphodiesterase [Micromonosporaceae bacterium]
MPPESSDRSTGPAVFAHRGSSAAFPEHTLAAYLRALDEGADGLECDVRLTSDGHLVCVHDRRLDRTSNGRGLVSELTLAELDELDFGSWHPAFPDTADELILERTGPNGDPRSHTRILTLERLLTAAIDADRPLRLLIETKHPTRFGGEVEARVAAMLRQYGLDEPNPRSQVTVAVMSFSPWAVRRMREIAPAVPTVLLLEFLPPGMIRDGRLPFGARIAGPGVRVVRSQPDLVKRLHDQGNQVYVWTVNDPRDIDLMIELGVDGIISDRPRLVLDRLGR